VLRLLLVRLHIIVGGRLVTVADVCRRLLLSVTLACATQLTTGQHAKAGQYSYVPLGRHLVSYHLQTKIARII